MNTETKEMAQLMDLIESLGYDLKPITIGELKAMQGDLKDKTPAEMVTAIKSKLEPKKNPISFDDDFKPGY